jgi:succinyldiaminopimelate transaminase
LTLKVYPNTVEFHVFRGIARRKSVNPLLAELGGYPLAAYQDLKRALAADAAPLHDFSIGDPIEPTPVFIRDALVAGVQPTSQYPTAAGLPELRAAIAAWVERRFKILVDPDTEVLPTAGSKEGVFHLPLGLLDARGDRTSVLWGTPGYPVYERAQRFAGGHSDPVALSADGGWRLELAALDSRRLDRACLAWLNYPHNPTGATVDLDFYRDALDTARERGFVLASDECYVDIHPTGSEPPASLLQAAGDDRSGVVVAFSLSKRSGMTGYRSGALVGDAELIAAQRTLRPNIGTASPEFVQRAAVAAWSDDDHVAQRRATFDAKRAIMLEFAATAGLEVSGTQATFYVWLAAPGGDDLAYAQALLRERVVVSPGRAFGSAGHGWLRLALVPSADGCRAAIEAWSAAIEAGRLPGHA